MKDADSLGSLSHCGLAPCSSVLSFLVGNSLVVGTSDVHLHGRSLLLKVIQIVLGLRKLLCCICQVLGQKGERVSMSVFNHDIGAEPETNFAGLVRELRLRPNVITDEEVGVDFIVTTIKLHLEHSDHFKCALDLGVLLLQAGLLAD